MDHGTYSHFILESVLKRSGARAFGDLANGLECAMTVEEASVKGFDLKSIGFHMPGQISAAKSTAVGSVGQENSDEHHDIHDSSIGIEENDDNDDASQSSADDGMDHAPLNPADLLELQRAVTCECPQAQITAMSPVKNASEIQLLMQLVPSHTSMSRIGSSTVRYQSLAAAFNSELEIQRLADTKAFESPGLGPKTPAQVKTFFDEVDKGLQVQTALAPVFEQYKNIRRGYGM